MAAAFAGALPEATRNGSVWAIGYLIGVGYLVLRSRRPWRRERDFLVFLGLAALGPRLAWAVGVEAPLLVDFSDYWHMAYQWVYEGDLTSWRRLHWPWGYPAWLSGLMWLFGPSLLVPRVANSLIGAATTLLVYGVAAQLLGRREARAAGMLYALWPGLIAWTSILCSEIPHSLCFVGGLWCLLRGRAEGERGGWSVAGGVLLAAAEIIRPVSLLLLVPFLAWSWFRNGQRPVSSRRPIRQSVRVLAAYGAVLGVFLAGKSLVVGYPCFSTSETMGLNLTCGLNPALQGRWNLADATLAWNAGSPREGNRRCLQVGVSRLQALTASPWRLADLVRRKFPIMWSRDAEGLRWTLRNRGTAAPVDQWMLRHGHAVRGAIDRFHAAMLLLAAVGFWRARHGRQLLLPAALLLTFMLAHTILEVQGRYMFPAKPFIAMAAAAAFVKRGVLDKDGSETAGDWRS